MSDKEVAQTPKPSNNFSRVAYILACIFLLSFSFSIGYVFGNSGFIVNLKNLPHVTLSRNVPVRELDFNLFWKVWDDIHVNYFDKTKVKDSDLVYGAIKGMVASIGDPYTVFLTPSENKITEDDLSGDFEGIGIQIGYRTGQLAVIAPLDGTPAKAAGVLAGDYILGIKDEAKGVDLGSNVFSLPEAVKAIRGPAGSQVELTLLRDGNSDPLKISITRKKIEVPSVVLDLVGKDKEIAHIKVSRFGAETKKEWDKVVDEITSNQNISSLAIDLRNNPGGYLQAAIELGSDFVDPGQPVVIQELANGTRENGMAVGKSARLKKYKTVVLINKGSASASEILAGALRDQLKLSLVGDTSFGKGTVQEPKEFDGGTGLHVTIAKWLTPSGIWVHEKGLEPDIKVADDTKTKDDEQLQKAIETLEK